MNFQIYPIKKIKKKEKKVKNSKQKERLKKKKFKIKLKDIGTIYNLAKKIEVEELYSNLNFGNKNIHFTCFIYLLIDIIYANTSNILNPKNMYLNVVPNFTDDYIKGSIKLHIKLKLIDIIKFIILAIKIYLKNKEGKKNESNTFNRKSYGDNS